jgi:hypothetical protein
MSSMVRLASTSLWVGVLAFGGALAQTYNARTGEIAMPGSPVAPDSPSQCDRLSSQWQSLQQQLDAAHQSCLDSHQSEPEDPRASMDPKDPTCSHPECQSLHSTRMQIAANADQAVTACRNQVAGRQRSAMQRLQAFQSTTPSPAPLLALPTPSSATQPQLAPDRTQVTQNIARSLDNNAPALKYLVAQQQAKYASDKSDSLDSPDPAAADPYATVDNSMFQPGNPPDSMIAPWQVGATPPQALSGGDYEQRLFVWRYVKEDSARCPAANLSGVTLNLEALFEETDVAHYHVTDGLIDSSVIDKNLLFLRCIPGSDTSYPMYHSFPKLYVKPNATTLGVRG